MKILNLRDKPQHLPVLARWHHAQWAYLDPDTSLEKRLAKMQAHLDEVIVPGTYIATDDDGNLLGSAAIVSSDMDTHPEWSPWLASVYVAPEHRRKGVGASLVRHVMQQARQAGMTTLYLFTPDQEHFYGTLGWQVLVREGYLGHDVVVMCSTLADATPGAAPE